MNETPDGSATPADDDTEVPRQVVSDNYERYLEDEYGYAYAARDILPLRLLESHDRLVEDPHGALETRDVEELDDFEKFGYARGLADEGELETFAAVLEALLDSDGDHDGLQYHEIPLFGARVALRHGVQQRATEWLKRGVEQWPDRARPARLLRARIALRSDEPDRASSVYAALVDDHPNDPELHFEIAEDLASEGYEQRASDWISRARETADRVDDDAIVVDLDVLESRIEGGEHAATDG